MDAEDDEFGDLYTDVLRPSFAPNPPPIPSTSNPCPDLNTNSDEDDIIFFGKNRYSSADLNDTPREEAKSPSADKTRAGEDEHIKVSISSESDTGQEARAEAQDADKAKVLPEGLMGMSAGIGGLDSGQLIIPGLSTGDLLPGVFQVGAAENGAGGTKAEECGDGDDDWDSDDSEDDLQILLNDAHGPMGAEPDGEEDEDGQDLVIVADEDQHIPGIEEQDWGEEAVQGTLDGEKKDAGEAAKGGGGPMPTAGTGGARYSNHMYHPHHSQFKYVRPGATVVSGGVAPAGAAPGQVRHPLAMGSISGRGRGDWRPAGASKNLPTMQKNFHSGFGLSSRSFGPGMEFTLPSHKTVFDIDIDSFEEKPWGYPGVDISDYFNFGLDEDNWKDYCKQLGQLRLEATMQSKIRVYESGRSEQDYDPELPPELAAAAGLHDVAAENCHLGKTDGGQMDSLGLGRGAARTRPPLPQGRAIQVEGGFGERLPSIDTRPARFRDSDAIIEIVLQDSADDDFNTANRDEPDRNQVDTGGSDGEFEDNDKPAGSEYLDQFSHKTREVNATRAPDAGIIHNDKHEGDGILPFPSGMPLQFRPNSKVQTPVYPGVTLIAPRTGRWPQGREKNVHTHSEHGNEAIPHQSTQNRSEHSNENLRTNIESKQISEGSSPVAVEASGEFSTEQRESFHDDGCVGAVSVEDEEVTSDVGAEISLNFERRKLSSQVAKPAVEDAGSGDEVRARHCDNSKANSGSSMDFQKQRDSGDDEVAQDSTPSRMGQGKRYHDEDEYSHRRRDKYNRDCKETDRTSIVAKGSEDLYYSYPHGDRDSNLIHHKRTKSESVERLKERKSSFTFHQKREDTHVRNGKDEMRRQDHVEDIASRHKNKRRESERIERDEHLHSKRRADDFEWRASHDKDIIPRHRDRDDVMINQHESMDDPHVKRRKDKEVQRKEQVEKDDALHGYRTREDSSRRKREKEDALDHRMRDNQSRERDRVDDHHSVRHIDDGWRVREREREERLRPKKSHEESHVNRDRDREESRSSIRSGRISDDKHWIGRAIDEHKGVVSNRDYQYKDKRRENEHNKRRDRQVGEASSSHHRAHDSYIRENHFQEDRRMRQDRSSSQNDRSTNASNSQRLSKERHQDNSRKSKESEGVDQNSQALGKRRHDDHNAQRHDKVNMKASRERDHDANALGHSNSRDYSQPRASSASVVSQKSQHHIWHEEHGPSPQRHASRKRTDDADSEDGQHHSSGRGRSKLERWTSQSERDNTTDIISPITSSMAKEAGRQNEKSPANMQMDEVTKKDDNTDADVVNHTVDPDNASSSEPKDVEMVAASGSQYADLDRPGDDHDRHLDTVEKLKKRSERFKLPMPSEKESAVNKKVEASDSSFPQGENAAIIAADTEIKQERPARKRRWNYKDLE